MYREPPDAEVIYCEFCQVPHLPQAKRCDHCGHRLGRAPDINAIRAKCDALVHRMIVGALAMAAMIAINALLFQGAGLLLFTAPIGWCFASAYQHYKLSSGIRAYQRRTKLLDP